MSRPDPRLRNAALPSAAAIAMLWPASPGLAATLGGQDLEVAHILDTVGYVNYAELAIASDGTAFVAMVLDDAGGSEVPVYRSTNGGKTWAAWGAALDVVPLGSIDLAVAPGVPEQLLMTYSVSSPSPPHLGSVSVRRADIDDATPSWQEEIVQSVTAPISQWFPHVSVLPGSSPAKVAVIWEEFDNPAKTLRYAYSSDGGATFSAPVALTTAPLGGHFDMDVALDAGGVVHAAWTFDDDVRGTAMLQYRRGTGGGASLSNWGSPVTLDGAVAYDAFAYVRLAASPASGGVIALLGENNYPDDNVDIHVSTDAGLTWPTPVKSFPGLWNAEAAWGDAGPAFGATSRDVYDRFDLVRPLGSPTGTWVAHEMLHPLDYSSIGSGAVPAPDPSRGGQFAMVAAMPNLEGDGTSPWFDAEWRADAGFGVPEFEPGHDVGGGTITSALAAADIDGDGDREVVFTASNPHRVSRFDLESLETTTLRTTGITSAASAPALIDVDGDGANEVFVGVDNGKVVGVRGDGTVVPGYPVDTGSGAATWVSCSRFTGTEYAEVVAATGRSIHVFGPAGAPASGFPYTAVFARGNVVGRAAIGDVDADGELELVAAFEHGVLVLGNTGAVERSLLLTGPSVSAGASLADLDDDGDLEIAVPRADGSVALLHHDGTTFGASWPWNSGTGQPIGSIAIADFFGGSDDELVFAALTGEVFAVDLNGAQPSGWSFAIGAHAEDAPEPVLSGLASAGKQIALGDPDGTGYVRRSVGPQAGWPRDFHADIEHAVAASDLDEDGNVELVIPAGDRLWVLDMEVADGPTNGNWPMAGARAARSGCRECDLYPPTGAPEVAAALLPAALHPGEPNPFLESTLLRYDVPAAGAGATVRIDVYDVGGRRVRTLVDEPKLPGSHAVRWDGRDAAGRAVASGVYLVRFRAAGAQESRRLVRLE